MSRRLARRALLLATLTLLAGQGCGRRGPPVAPELRLPGPVTELDGVVGPSGIELAWTLPTRRVDQTRLQDLTATRVYRSEVLGTAEPRPALLERGRIRGYTEIAHIRLDAPAPATVEQSRARFIDRHGLTFGRRYTYVVLSEDRNGRVSAPSPRLTLVFAAPPEPPGNVVAQAAESAVRLTWEPPARLLDGTPAGGGLTYEVLRATAPDSALAPLPGPPVTTTSVVDRGLENDRAYYYAIRAVRTEAGTRAVSDVSARVAATPVDTTAPSAPRDLVAIVSADTVRLSWRPSPEPDVAAYVIYRGGEGTERMRIGSTSAPGTTFIDRDVPPGRYHYAVTAVDASSRRNESGRSTEATVSVP